MGLSFRRSASHNARQGPHQSAAEEETKNSTATSRFAVNVPVSPLIELNATRIRNANNATSSAASISNKHRLSRDMQQYHEAGTADPIEEKLDQM